MMRNWLIRTKSNRIIGPLSKEKVIGYFKAGKLHLEDEITQGNGFWVKVSEEELVNKFLLKGEEQSFNPISEADDVLTISNVVEKFPPGKAKAKNIEKLPSDEDLEYPDIERTNPDLEIEESLDKLAASGEDVTKMININDLKLETQQSFESSAQESNEKFEESTSIRKVPSLDDEGEEKFDENRGEGLPTGKDLEYPDVDTQKNDGDTASKGSDDLTGPIISTYKPFDDDEVVKKSVRPVKGSLKSQTAKVEKNRSKRRNESYIYLILLFAVALLMTAFFLYKKVFRKPLLSSLFISESQARVDEHPLKKKIF